MIDPDVFNGVPLFSMLDGEERKVLAQQVSMRSFRKGEMIFKAGDRGMYAYLIQRGLVHVSLLDGNGEPITVDVVDEGGLVGMSSLLAEGEHLTTSMVMEDTDAIEIDRSDLEALLKQKPLAGLDMLTMVEKQMRSTYELMRTRAAKNPNQEIEDTETLGDHLADAVARFGGSWKFVILFGVTLVAYTTANILLAKPWDPYPFILLNLFLSMLAAIQAPVIMMSQNRQDAKDRVRSELDYRVNLKAELEIEEVLVRLGALEARLAERERGE